MYPHPAYLPSPAMTLRHHATPFRPHGFTLIELLAVITIIGILAAIIIPVAGKARATADKAQCISALRSWGIALQSYADDNRDWLPPDPANGTLRILTKATTTEKRHLVWYLAPWLGLPPELVGTPGGRIPDNVICRAWLRQTPDRNSAIWALNEKYSPQGKSNPNQDSTAWNPWGDTGTPRRRLSEILSGNAPSTQWLIKDIDGAISGINPADTATLPPSPVHGKRRNQLYWDWHVK
ncbi:MAG: prepilin-type N-terminal cleavage/methylation domain-containing protein [Opitutaceae bacterium]|nr:prepilin-type N-terminal cleavage/methylation domain-containing protein [Opitutaceae bacterium]